MTNDKNRAKDGGRTGELIKPMTYMTATKRVKTLQRLLVSCHVCAQVYTHEHTPTDIKAHPCMHPDTLSLLKPPSPLSLHLYGLQAINSWNRALANSFIQSLVERQNAHSLWCTPWQDDTGSGGWLPRQPLHPISPSIVSSKFCTPSTSLLPWFLCSLHFSVFNYTVASEVNWTFKNKDQYRNLPVSVMKSHFLTVASKIRKETVLYFFNNFSDYNHYQYLQSTSYIHEQKQAFTML